MKIDLGSSFHKMPGHLGVDILKVEQVDVVADARNLPFKDSSIEGIYSNHCIEHIVEQLDVIREMWRVCKDGAVLHILVPHFSNPSYYDDLTHQRLYSTRSFEHYDFDLHEINAHPNYLPEVNLKLEFVKINYWPEHIIVRKVKWKQIVIQLIRAVFNLLANANQFLCERIWCRWVGGFYEVEYKLKVIKDA